jgi:hypothetical protein
MKRSRGAGLPADACLLREEYYHRPAALGHGGVATFHEHVRGFFRGRRTVPVAKTDRGASGEVTFTFSARLLRCFLRRRNPLLTPCRVALEYGFGGHSRGGRSGIYYQRRTDTGLRRETERLVRVHAAEIEADLEMAPTHFDMLKPVKIVWAEPSGRRVVGVFNEANRRMIFLGFARY